MPYKDVDKNDWYYDTVKYVYDYNIMTGLNTTTFGPAVNLSREQVAVILHRLEGKPTVSYSNKFKDVPAGQWYSDGVSWAYQNGIITGYTNGYFGVSDSITRQDLSVMLYRYARYKGYDVSTTSNIYSFPDYRDVSDYANQAVSWATGMKIITGDNGNIKPRDKSSRAVAATIITRFMKAY